MQTYQGKRVQKKSEQCSCRGQDSRSSGHLQGTGLSSGTGQITASLLNHVLEFREVNLPIEEIDKRCFCLVLFSKTSDFQGLMKSHSFRPIDFRYFHVHKYANFHAGFFDVAGSAFRMALAQNSMRGDELKQDKL